MKKLRGKDLIALGFTEGKSVGAVLEFLKKNFKKDSPEYIAEQLKLLLTDAQAYTADPILGPLATKMVENTQELKEKETIPLKDGWHPYTIFGAEHIEAGALTQMNTAMKLPVTVAGALMPDAHQGYGLPIGGVLATRNAVIPYGVGVDIGCRMALSVYDVTEEEFEKNRAQYQRELVANTAFGAGNGFLPKHRTDHDIMDSAAFEDNALLRSLKDKAYSQLGSSGGGNHFVEWGIIAFAERDEALGIDAGKYLALLTHSGSRGFGATIAGHYTRSAKELCRLPHEAAHLAYLGLDSEAGHDYWVSMQLAGDYASACHDVIHRKMTSAIKATVLAKVENHHNFAWKELYDGEEVVVHRKGATPAGAGVMGIIPGSMTAPGFLVRGRGNASALFSASHGAGRQMSRTKANASVTKSELKKVLKENDVILLGGGTDEAPMAYKDINLVMQAQTELVDVVARFQPRLVRMADDGSRED